MARIRSIKPEFFTSLSIASLDLPVRLTFIGLWTHCDDEGRCVDEARLIKAALWPLDDRTAGDVEGDLGALSEASLITRYEVDGRRYLAVCGWDEHQRINRPTKSKLPAPDDPSAVRPKTSVACGNEGRVSVQERLTEDSLSAHDRKGKEQGTGNREQGEEPSSEAAPHDPPPRIDVERLCNHLADCIEANGSKRPTVTKKWRDSARLLMDADGRSEQQVRNMIDWCQASTFWRAHILSMPKLREKYDQMRLQANQDRTSPPTQAQRSTTDERVAQAQALKAKFAAAPSQSLIVQGEISS